MTLICKQNSCGDVHCRCAADDHVGSAACCVLRATCPDHQLIIFPHTYTRLAFVVKSLWNIYKLFRITLQHI